MFKYCKFMMLFALLFSSCLSVGDALSLDSINEKYEDKLANNKDDWNIAHYVAAFGSSDEMEIIVNQTDLIDAQDKMGNTPVLIAQLFDNIETFEILVNMNCDIRISNNIGGNPSLYLGYFDKSQYKLALEILNDSGHDFDDSCYNNASLLHYAVRGGNLKLVKEIMEYSPDLLRTDGSHGLYPIDFSLIASYKYDDFSQFDKDIYEREKQIVNLLLQKGSEEPVELPLQMGYFGNLFFNIYVIIDTLTSEQLELSDVNSPDSFNVLNINNRPHAILTRDIIHNLFEKFNMLVSLDNITTNCVSEIHRMLKAEETYMILANVSGNPYVTNYWTTFQSFREDSFYRDFIKVYSSDSMYRPILFRVKDITELIAIKIEE